MDMERREFLKVTGAAAVAGMALTSAAGAADALVLKKFKETKRIPVNAADPSALAIASDGKIYAGGENALVTLDADGNEIGRQALKGRPECLCVSPDGKLLVAMRDHVEVMNPQGPPVPPWPAIGPRAYLTSIAADDNNVYVADAGNRVVLRFDHGGHLQNKIGERNKEMGVPGLIVPSPYFDVAIDPQGALWVVNPGKHGLENYRPDGELVSSWYRSGMDMKSFCGCCNPIHIAFRSDSSLVTAEKGLNRVKVYGPDTNLVGVVWAGAVPPIEENKALTCDVEPPIMSLAVDQKNRILVLNKPDQKILVYEQENA